jgi:mono/diheme cytochrome c family protein
MAVKIIVAVVVVVIVVAAAAAGPVLALGHRADLPFERQLGHLAIKMAASSMKDAQIPSNLDRRASINGRMSFTGSCAVCHGAAGDGKGVFGQALYPPAPDFKDDLSKDLTDGERFWIIKNGLSFVNMPAFGNVYSDDRIWELVTYIKDIREGRAQAASIIMPTSEQLAFADPNGTPEQRGASLYFSEGCSLCHGPIGDAPGDLRLRNGRTVAETLPRGAVGMPRYPADTIDDTQTGYIAAYLNQVGGGAALPQTALPDRPSTDDAG